MVWHFDGMWNTEGRWQAAGLPFCMDIADLVTAQLLKSGTISRITHLHFLLY
ncbi:hypothetical protein ACJX0J_005713, partial [Zea mays]